MGRPAGEVDARDFMNGRRHLARAAYDAFDDLASRYDVVVAEGAGSPAEINLRASDYVNMGLARHAAMPTVVVGDIDRGGVLAAMFGTVALLEAADQALVAGFVINKFRGDESLLTPGLHELEALTGRRRLRCAAVAPGPVARLGGRAGPRGTTLERRGLQGGDRPVPADQQLHRRRRAGARAGPRRLLRLRAASDRRRRPRGAAGHPRDAQRPRLAADPWPRRCRAGPRCRRASRSSGICGGCQMLGGDDHRPGRGRGCPRAPRPSVWACST